MGGKNTGLLGPIWLEGGVRVIVYISLMALRPWVNQLPLMPSVREGTRELRRERVVHSVCRLTNKDSEQDLNL